MDLATRRHWIFDMDGTLAVAVHDFAAIRRALELPAEAPILEAIESLAEPRRTRTYARLDEIELELANRAQPAPGAAPLLERLTRIGADLGIVTRNSHSNALQTLRAAGLLGFFAPEHVLGREAAAPKPSPAGVLHLIELWNGRPEHAVMVGDFKNDLLAGRAAGTATAYVDPTGAFPWAEHADLAVESLDAIAGRLA